MSSERRAIDILEESVNLLRAAPPRAFVTYLAGAIPFVLALLFFLNDMTRSPFAFERLGVASLVLAALYVWKNLWQALFARQLYEMLSPRPVHSPHITTKGVLKLILIQAALQPIGLAVALPFPWLVAFFRNAALFAALGTPDALRTARRQAVLWTRQNWGVIALMTLAGLLVFLNVLIMIVLLPQLARSFLGIEGEFARLGSRILNPTTLAVAASIAWMVIDPLLDAVYVLRCFYGESMATGEDLRSAFRSALKGVTATIVLLLALIGAFPRPAMAQVDPAKLDRSIDEVIHRREFTWRTPRPPAEEPQGRWVAWVRSAENVISGLWESVKKTIHDWLRQKPESETGGRDAPVTRRLMEVLIATAVALIAGSLIFFLRRRPSVIAARAVTLAAPVVNLADESVTADQLPENSWLALAEEWLAKGDCRLALRALYLAGLNHLSQRGMVSIQKWKTGVDYQQELYRRAKSIPGSPPEIGPIFTDNVAIFERGWYGRHAVNRETVEAFAEGLTQIRNHANQ